CHRSRAPCASGRAAGTARHGRSLHPRHRKGRVLVKLDPFYLIVDSADWIERLVPEGVKLVQLRMKDVPEERLRADIRRAGTVCAAHGCQLIVNDYWQIAIEEDCDFVH